MKSARALVINWLVRIVAYFCALRRVYYFAILFYFYLLYYVDANMNRYLLITFTILIHFFCDCLTAITLVRNC